jgi:choline kinase
MQARILAAGIGKRMKDFTEGPPKCLLKVNSRTSLYLLNYYNLAGVVGANT